MVRKTWLHSEGYKVDCKCSQTSLSLSGATITIDLSDVVSKLDTIISQGTSQNTNLSNILTQIASQNTSATQTMFFETGTTVIPAGVYSYFIVNLGLDPTDADSTKDSILLNGLELNGGVFEFGNDVGGNRVLQDPVTVDANGNTLLIVYNS